MTLKFFKSRNGKWQILKGVLDCVVLLTQHFPQGTKQSVLLVLFYHLLNPRFYAIATFC